MIWRKSTYEGSGSNQPLIIRVIPSPRSWILNRDAPPAPDAETATQAVVVGIPDNFRRDDVEPVLAAFNAATERGFRRTGGGGLRLFRLLSHVRRLPQWHGSLGNHGLEHREVAHANKAAANGTPTEGAADLRCVKPSNRACWSGSLGCSAASASAAG